MGGGAGGAVVVSLVIGHVSLLAKMHRATYIDGSAAFFRCEHIMPYTPDEYTHKHIALAIKSTK